MARLFRMKYLGRLTAVLSVSLVSACAQDRPPVKGFVLPEGDTDKGALVFVESGCPQCHWVVGSDIAQPQDPDFQIQLGGNISYVKHYGDLLTSVVSPDHSISAKYQAPDGYEEPLASPMPIYRDTLTVAQLIDLIEFLHSKYTTVPTYAGKYYYYP